MMIVASPVITVASPSNLRAIKKNGKKSSSSGAPRGSSVVIGNITEDVQILSSGGFFPHVQMCWCVRLLACWRAVAEPSSSGVTARHHMQKLV